MFYLEPFSLLANLSYRTCLTQIHQGRQKSCQMSSDHSKLQITHRVSVFQLYSSHGESGGGPQSNSTLTLGSSFTLHQPFLLWNFGETNEQHTGNGMGWVDPHIHFSVSVFMHLCELCDNIKYGELLNTITLQGSSSFVFSFVSPFPWEY